MDTARPDMVSDIEQVLRDNYDTPPEMLCMMPGALAGPVAEAEAALAAAAATTDRRLALEIVQGALATLTGLPGQRANATRQRLSRLFHQLRKGEQAGMVVEAGALGPVAATCTACGEEFEAPYGRQAPQHTRCPRCRRAGKESPMGAQPLRLETAPPAPPAIAPETQECNTCHTWKPLDAFGQNGRGRLKICKECFSKKVGEAWEKRRQAEVPTEPAAKPVAKEKPETPKEPTVGADEKLCHRCGKVKPRSDFARRTSAKDGLQTQCKECIAEQGKARAPRARKMAAKVEPVFTPAVGEPAAAPAQVEPFLPPAVVAVEQATQPDPRPFGRLNDVVEQMRIQMAGVGLGPDDELPRNWAVLAAPALLAVGALALGAWIFGRVFHAE